MPGKKTKLSLKARVFLLFESSGVAIVWPDMLIRAMSSLTNFELLELMASKHHLKSLHSLHEFAVEAPCRSSQYSLKMIKSLLKVHVLQHLGHAVRVLSNAKSMAMELLNKKNTTDNHYNFKLKKRRKKKLFGFFKLHLNWSSSYVIPMPELSISEKFDANHMYYDSTWNSAVSFTEDTSVTEMEPPLAGYLDWLEKNSEAAGGDIDEGSEIDKLAEKFIASCHEKFRLEKQESYRRYQEMLARSI